MKEVKVIAAKDFTTTSGLFYLAGDVIDNLSFEQIIKLNELGFIEPLSTKDLVLLKRELDKKNKSKEEL